ncbi:hypothetical protein BDQ17DRAFT_1440774 [Cyathus striatus]|nr:hypothetical protein BDQ17DRAFT_1440774 [Cyathus striatus]
MNHFETLEPPQRALLESLITWRREKATEKFGAAAVHTYGSRLLLADSQLSRIVDCAQTHKILSIEQLVQETRWRREWAEEYGQSILSIIAIHFPPPPVQLEVQDGSTQSSTEATLVARLAHCQLNSSSR